MGPRRGYLQGDRVRIRPWQHRDLVEQELWPRYTDPFSTLWNTPRSITNDDKDYSRPFSDTASIRRVWAVEDMRQRLIGRISLREVEQQAGRARLGISLGAPYVGQGLGTETLSLFLDYFFGPMDFLTMLLDVAAFNRRAVRCYERLNFRYVGSDWRYVSHDASLRLLEDPVYSSLRPFFRRDRRGAWVQFLEMELYRDEWLQARAHPG